MLRHDRKDHCWVLAPLGFVDRNGIGQNHLVKLRKVVTDWLSVKIDGQLPFLPVDLQYLPDVPVKDLLVVDDRHWFEVLTGRSYLGDLYRLYQTVSG